MSISLKSLVAIRMNEIFPRLACYCQELKYFVRKSRQRQTLALWKEAVKMKLEQFFLKWYLRSFWSVLACDKSSRSQCSSKKVFLKITQYSQEKTGVGKETPTQVFSWEYYENFKNSFFHRTHPVSASVEIIHK